MSLAREPQRLRIDFGQCTRSGARCTAADGVRAGTGGSASDISGSQRLLWTIRAIVFIAFEARLTSAISVMGIFASLG
ncbi:hypothetical protein WJ30_10785 [Burkholderia diffusa]|nr:hypothetical protein WJ30_10785 [Burkholderia diffusa]